MAFFVVLIPDIFDIQELATQGHLANQAQGAKMRLVASYVLLHFVAWDGNICYNAYLEFSYLVGEKLWH